MFSSHILIDDSPLIFKKFGKNRKFDVKKEGILVLFNGFYFFFLTEGPGDFRVFGLFSSHILIDDSPLIFKIFGKKSEI